MKFMTESKKCSTIVYKKSCLQGQLNDIQVVIVTSLNKGSRYGPVSLRIRLYLE